MDYAILGAGDTLPTRVVIRALITTLLLLYAIPGLGQPNVLVLMAEDLSPRIGAYGDDYAQTPNIDSLAQKATRYTHAFTTAGVCAPSRAAFITGQHQIAFGGQHMRASTSPLGPYLAQPAPEVRAFPEILRAHGYYTFTDQKLDYQFSGIRAHSGPFTIWNEENASDTAWRNRVSGQPFFGLINFIETHESGVMRQSGAPHSKSHAASQAMRAPITALREKVSDPNEVSLPPYFPDNRQSRQDLARHYDNIHLMDKRVGRILAELAKDDLLDNTIIVWTTDHGDGLPRSKREVLDSGTHVPLLIAMPGQRPSESHQLVSFVDFAPTILTWAGIALPKWLHGQDINDSPRQYVFSSRDRIDEVLDRQRAVRSSRYRYIRSWHPDVPGGHPLNYRDNIDMVREWRALHKSAQLNAQQDKWFRPVGAEQLYDLKTDPYELTNLATSQAHADIKATLQGVLQQFLLRVGDTSTQSEAVMRDAFLQDGKMPITPKPSISVNVDGLVSLKSSIGASIGYRTGGKWQLYTKQLNLNGFSGALEAKSIRYGWRESEVVSQSF